MPHKTIQDQAKSEIASVSGVIRGYADRADRACEIAYRHGQNPRDQAWVIDQMIRALQGDKYDQWIDDATNHGEEEWDMGTAP